MDGSNKISPTLNLEAEVAGHFIVLVVSSFKLSLKGQIVLHSFVSSGAVYVKTSRWRCRCPETCFNIDSFMILLVFAIPSPCEVVFGTTVV